MSNADNAVNAIDQLETEFHSVEKTTMSTVMEAFVRISEKHGGVPFKAMPAEFTLTCGKEPEFKIHAHVAVFADATGKAAFAAALFHDDSSEFAGLHSNSPNWPEWLDTIVQRMHNGTIEALRTNPGISTARH